MKSEGFLGEAVCYLGPHRQTGSLQPVLLNQGWWRSGPTGVLIPNTSIPQFHSWLQWNHKIKPLQICVHFGPPNTVPFPWEQGKELKGTTSHIVRSWHLQGHRGRTPIQGHFGEVDPGASGCSCLHWVPLSPEHSRSFPTVCGLYVTSWKKSFWATWSKTAHLPHPPLTPVTFFLHLLHLSAATQNDLFILFLLTSPR
jgi:hypothetical protein